MMSSVWALQTPLVLASKSAIRKHLLEQAGLAPEIIVADFDERQFEASVQLIDKAPKDRAPVLASEKARLVCLNRPGHYVVGADQILILGDEVLHKSHDRKEAKRTLERLSGKTHRLVSAVAVALDGAVRFSSVDEAALTMRSLDSNTIDAYLDRAGPAITESVGCYEIEALGIHLFERVEGGFFTIMGLPLEPLLGFFRRERCLTL